MQLQVSMIFWDTAGLYSLRHHYHNKTFLLARLIDKSIVFLVDVHIKILSVQTGKRSLHGHPRWIWEIGWWKSFRLGRKCNKKCVAGQPNRVKRTAPSTVPETRALKRSPQFLFLVLSFTRTLFLWLWGRKKWLLSRTSWNEESGDKYICEFSYSFSSQVWKIVKR